MKNRKRLLKRIMAVFLLLSIAFMILPQLIIRDWVNMPQSFGNRMLVLYYSFSILGAIGTCSAVIIALFSEEIKVWLYKPDININFKDKNGIEEKVDVSQQTPIAESYSCIVELSNEGFVNAVQSSLKIVDIEYGKSKDKTKSIKSWMGAKIVGNTFDVLIDYPYEIRLFSIKNPVSYGTPSDAKTESNPLISIYGVSLDERYRTKGVWRVNYCFVSQNGASQKFTITIEWDGAITSRRTEMLEHLKVTKQ